MAEQVSVVIRAEYQVGVSRVQFVGRRVTATTEENTGVVMELVTEGLRQINTELKALIR